MFIDRGVGVGCYPCENINFKKNNIDGGGRRRMLPIRNVIQLYYVKYGDQMG